MTQHHTFIHCAHLDAKIHYVHNHCNNFFLWLRYIIFYIRAHAGIYGCSTAYTSTQVVQRSAEFVTKCGVGFLEPIKQLAKLNTECQQLITKAQVLHTESAFAYAIMHLQLQPPKKPASTMKQIISQHEDLLASQENGATVAMIHPLLYETGKSLA